jgi:hypothetical protein
MYKWKIDISLKSGQNISGLYRGPEENSFDVGKVLIVDDPSVTVFAIMSLDETAQLFIMRDEVAAMGISIFVEPIDNTKNI